MPSRPTTALPMSPRIHSHSPHHITRANGNPQLPKPIPKIHPISLLTFPKTSPIIKIVEVRPGPWTQGLKRFASLPLLYRHSALWAARQL